jgi:NAD(P)-dependent dehydrogenase (short-subunit alcohol dehydrogenase family)
LVGKVAIVTGAAARGPGLGTGTATAILFAREGAKRLLINRSESPAWHLPTEIEQEGEECSVCAADVTKAAEVESMVAVADQRYGKLDILINIVGIGASGTVVSVTEDASDTMMTVYLKSMMWCCKFGLPVAILVRQDTSCS